MNAIHCSILFLSLAGSAAALQGTQQTAPIQPAKIEPAQIQSSTTQPTPGPAAARLGPATTQAQTAKPQATSGQPASSFTTEQLEQIVAPIALYPDSLLAQVLMASTYPLEIVEASRWVQKNPKLKEKELESALQQQTWDPAVKSLCGIADVLKRMSDNLDWTQDLGDAFLGQKADLMAAVQTMRRKAFEAGNLKSSKEMTVTEQTDKIIVIEQAQPEVVYVPTYYPTAVYGSWGYPYYYYPPMYPPAPAGGMFFSFAAGVFWGAAIWGDCNWGGSDVDIDIDHHNTFVDRTERPERRQDAKDKVGSGGRFEHNPEHRKGVGYKDNKVAQKYGGAGGQSRVSRDQARGYGDRAAQRPAGGGAGVTRPGGGSVPTQTPTTRPGGGSIPSQRPAAGGSSGARPTPSAQPRTSGQRSGSYSGSRSPNLDRAGSARGSASRGSAGARGGGRGGGGRGGGGRR